MKPSQRKSRVSPATPAPVDRKTPPTLEQIRQRARELYVARGSAAGMALNDWLQAEQELRREFKKQH